MVLDWTGSGLGLRVRFKILVRLGLRFGQVKVSSLRVEASGFGDTRRINIGVLQNAHKLRRNAEISLILSFGSCHLHNCQVHTY